MANRTRKNTARTIPSDIQALLAGVFATQCTCCGRFGHDHETVDGYSPCCNEPTDSQGRIPEAEFNANRWAH